MLFFKGVFLHFLLHFESSTRKGDATPNLWVNLSQIGWIFAQQPIEALYTFHTRTLTFDDDGNRANAAERCHHFVSVRWTHKFHYSDPVLQIVRKMASLYLISWQGSKMFWAANCTQSEPDSLCVVLKTELILRYFVICLTRDGWKNERKSFAKFFCLHQNGV